MKNKILPWLLAGSIIGAFFASLVNVQIPQSYAATLTKGYTFTTNEQVTAAKLHSLVDSATISGITTADLADGGTTLAKLAANSVDTTKIVDATIQGADISNRTITASLIVTNTITANELSTNLTFLNGFLNFTNTVVGFTNSAIAGNSVAGVTNSTGSGDANKIVKLNPSGLVDRSMLVGTSSIIITNLVGTNITHGSTYTYTPILSFSTTITNGSVIVKGVVCNDDPTGSSSFMRLRDSGTNVFSSVHVPNGSMSPVMEAHVMDTLTTATKTYVMEVASSSAATENYTNTLTSADTAAPAINSFYIQIIQLP